MTLLFVNFSFLNSLFYFFLGIFLTLYFLMILKKDQTKKINEFENNSIVKFYLNIFILNKEEALSNVIKAKMANKFVASIISSFFLILFLTFLTSLYLFF